MPHATTSAVTEIPAARSDHAEAHFAGLLAFETDRWGTHQTIVGGSMDFALETGSA
jgi:hypothetical protein